jgi:hypothetical protein
LKGVFKTNLSQSSTPVRTVTLSLVLAYLLIIGVVDFSLVSAAPPSRSVAAPTFSPVGGTFASPQNVSIQCATVGATIHYTTNGTDPSENSTVYSVPILVSVTTTIKAQAFNTKMEGSEIATATYTISIVVPRVATPTFNPAGGTFSLPQSVTLSCSTSGATIRYTIDGSEPTAGSLMYLNPVLVGATTTIKAKAFRTGMQDSNTASTTYIINIPRVATPTFNPLGGIYSRTQLVVIQCATSGATVRYATNGSDPSSSSPVYSSPIMVSANMTLKAKAFKSGMAESSTASATYAINIPPPKVATPTFGLAVGTYSSPQNVDLSCSTTGASIRYTTDGSGPGSSSALYSEPISINSTTTVRAKAFKRV